MLKLSTWRSSSLNRLYSDIATYSWPLRNIKSMFWYLVLKSCYSFIMTVIHVQQSNQLFSIKHTEIDSIVVKGICSSLQRQTHRNDMFSEKTHWKKAHPVCSMWWHMIIVYCICHHFFTWFSCTSKTKLNKACFQRDKCQKKNLQLCSLHRVIPLMFNKADLHLLQSIDA